jgi:hypothetical protein
VYGLATVGGHTHQQTHTRSGKSGWYCRQPRPPRDRRLASRVEPFLAKALSGSRCPFSRRLRSFARLGCYLCCLFLLLLVPIVQGMLFHLGRELVEPARRSLVCVDGQPFGLDRTGKGPMHREIAVVSRHTNSGPRRKRNVRSPGRSGRPAACSLVA